MDSLLGCDDAIQHRKTQQLERVTASGHQHNLQVAVAVGTHDPVASKPVTTLKDDEADAIPDAACAGHDPTYAASYDGHSHLLARVSNALTHDCLWVSIALYLSCVPYPTALSIDLFLAGQAGQQPAQPALPALLSIAAACPTKLLIVAHLQTSLHSLRSQPVTDRPGFRGSNGKSFRRCNLHNRTCGH